MTIENKIQSTFLQRVRNFSMGTVLATILAATGCSDDQQGCKNDSECRDPRICIEGACVNPGGSDTYDSSSPHDTGGSDDYDAGSPHDTNQTDQMGNDQPVCTSHARTVCYEDDVFWQDSCGELEGISQDCREDQYCNNGRCVDEEPECTSHANRRCHEGDVYWQDSCGELEERLTNCRADEVCIDARCVTVEHDVGRGEDIHSFDYGSESDTVEHDVGRREDIPSFDYGGYSDYVGLDSLVGTTYIYVIITDVTEEESSATHTAGADICGIFAETRYGNRIPPFSVDRCHFGPGDNSAATDCTSFQYDTCFCNPDDPDFVSLGGRGGNLIVSFYPPLADSDRVVIHECAIENDSYDLFIGEESWSTSDPATHYCGQWVDSSATCLLPDDFR